MPTLITITCAYCNCTIEKNIKRVNEAKKFGWRQVCSKQCSQALKTTATEVNCQLCGRVILRVPSALGSHIFCSSSCAATFNNMHKKTGCRRSKLESWLQEELTKLFPNLSIKYNEKDAINSELDIYIPELCIAFELNGIFHYEPIYGSDKLSAIQNNDNRKFQACLEKNIELCIINTSSQKYVTDKTSKQYLDIITTIINSKLLASP